MNATTSAKYNIGRYGVKGHSIASDKGKVLKVFNAANNEDDNWLEAVKWGADNLSKIKDMRTTKAKRTARPKAKSTAKKKTKKATSKKRIKLSAADAAHVRTMLKDIRKIGAKYRNRGKQTSLF